LPDIEWRLNAVEHFGYDEGRDAEGWRELAPHMLGNCSIPIAIPLMQNLLEAG
jgi:hypothetical protein